MTTYDQWKTDPDFDGRQSAAIEAQERAEQEDGERIERARLKSVAFDWFAQFMRRIDQAHGYKDFEDIRRKVGAMPDLLLTYPKEPEIQF
jgi:hypothetical protein